MSEEWRGVVGFETKYEVSNLGRVRSLFYGNRYGSFPRDEPLILTPIPIEKGGHLRVKLTKDGKTISALVHALVLGAFIGLCPAGMEGCHGDGNPTNNQIGNLRWDTHAANMHDCVAHGTVARGERAGRARLTEAQVVEIKTRLALGIRRGRIADELGLDFGLVDNVARNRAWSWVTL